MKKIIKIIIISTISIWISILLNQLNFLTKVENYFFDQRVKIADPYTTSHSDIILLLIDENSLNELSPLLGRWPWPRFIYYDILEFLHLSNVKSINIDILFTESQANNQNQIEDDHLLSLATHQFQPVNHAMKLSIDKLRKNINNDELPAIPDYFQKKISLPSDLPLSLFKKTSDYFLPFPQLAQKTNYSGFVDIITDSDGIVRKVDLIRRYKNKLYPSFALSQYIQLTQASRIQAYNDKLMIDQINIPLLSDQTYLIKMKQDFKTISAASVIQSIQALKQGRINDMSLSPTEFENKIIFIGTSASATYDLINVPLMQNIPGVYVHASILDNFLQKDFYYSTPLWINIIITIVLTILCTAIIFLIHQLLLQIGLIFSIVIGWMTVNTYLFISNSTILLLGLSLVSLAITIILSFGYLRLTEAEEKKKIKSMFSKYVSPSILDEILKKKKETLLPEIGKKENLTMFFSDIRDFSTLTEKSDVNKLISVLNHYLNSMVNIIYKNEGTLDKFIGDAIMAFWGAPVLNKNHPYLTVKAALEMVEEKNTFNTFFKNQNWPEINFGIGIHTGAVILGNIGSEKFLNYTIIGNNVNITSRLEGITKFYKTPIIVSETTAELIEKKILIRPIDTVQLKGIDKPITIYEPICLHKYATKKHRDKKELTTKALTYYKKKQFKKAITCYDKLLEIQTSDGLAKLMKNRCTQYIKTPPPSTWEAVYKFTTK